MGPGDDHASNCITEAPHIPVAKTWIPDVERQRISCAQTYSATGPALQAAFMVMSAVGGKLLLFQAASPSVGVGRIKNRDLPALYGTDRHAS